MPGSNLWYLTHLTQLNSVQLMQFFGVYPHLKTPLLLVTSCYVTYYHLAGHVYIWFIQPPNYGTSFAYSSNWVLFLLNRDTQNISKLGCVTNSTNNFIIHSSRPFSSQPIYVQAFSSRALFLSEPFPRNSSPPPALQRRSCNDHLRQAQSLHWNVTWIMFMRAFTLLEEAG